MINVHENFIVFFPSLHVVPDDTLNLAPPTAAEDHAHLVEVEEPLLEDGDPSSLGRDVCVNFVMEGVSITLNDEQQNSDAMSTGVSSEKYW